MGSVAFLMGDAYFLSVLIIVATTLFIVGFWKKQYFITLAAGIGYILFGLFLISGVHYSVLSSSNATSVVSNSTTVLSTSFNYSTLSWQIPFNPTTSFFFILIGLLLIYVAIFEFFRAPSVKDNGDDD